MLNAAAKDAVKAVDEVYAAALGTEKLIKDYAPVTPARSRLIKEAAGLDVSGFRHAVDAGAFRYIMKTHGEIELADLEKIPEIAARGNIAQGADPGTILYSITIGAQLFFLEEIHKGKKRLAAKTMWKRKAPETHAAQ